MICRRLFKIAFLVLAAGCDLDHSDSPYIEVPVANTEQSSRVGGRDEMQDWTTSGILPRVIHRHYFDASEVADVTVEPERFGFVRPLGNDLFTFLAYANGEVICNIHQEHLDQFDLTLKDANEIALTNLRRIAFDGSTIQQRITKTETGNDWAVWFGNEFTSSCVLLPELHSWSAEHLKADSFLVRVASTQMIFVLQHKHRDSLPEFNQYIAKVLEDSDNLVSEEWFVLDQGSLTPLTDE